MRIRNKVSRMNKNVNRRFESILNTFPNALTAFIDLLGTSNLYNSDDIKNSFDKVYSAIIENFDLKFTEYFPTRNYAEHFNICIFGDSIFIIQRISNDENPKKLLDFLLDFSSYLCLNCSHILSRSLLFRAPIFSVNIAETTVNSIFHSRYTSVSLSGGKEVLAEKNHFLGKGLPMGVYVSEELNSIIVGQSIKVNEELYFVVPKEDIVISCLPANTLDLISKQTGYDNKLLSESLKQYLPEKVLPTKFIPWALAGLRVSHQIKPINKSRFLVSFLSLTSAYWGILGSALMVIGTILTSKQEMQILSTMFVDSAEAYEIQKSLIQTKADIVMGLFLIIFAFSTSYLKADSNTKWTKKHFLYLGLTTVIFLATHFYFIRKIFLQIFM